MRQKKQVMESSMKPNPVIFIHGMWIHSGAWQPNAKQFHYAFGNMLTEEESGELHSAWTIPGPGKALI
jgi:hypothetical protein